MAGRILVLDDEENYAEMLQDLLLQNNYRVDMVTRTDRAISMLEEIPYDLVVSDYKMPVMDGAGFLKKAREIYPNLPFILVSGLMNTPELVKVANMSVTLVLEKPLDTATFLEQVRRFSEPMTDEEARAYEREGDSGGEAGASAGVTEYPDQPRFYSGICDASRYFLQQLWEISSKHSMLFVLDPVGCDGEFAVRDLSRWKGQEDRIVERVELQSLFGGSGVALLEEILSNEEKSNVVCVRAGDFNLAEDFEKLRVLEDEVLLKVKGAERLALVVLFRITDSDKAVADQLFEFFGDRTVSNPGLRLRLPDLAHYANRALRSIQERRQEPAPIKLGADAVFALLTYSWPRNYTELQEVLQRAVAEAGDVPVSIEAIRNAIGDETIEAVAPDERMGRILQGRQADTVLAALERADATVREVADSFGLDLSQVGSVESLRKAPLVNPRLASL